VKLLLIKGYYQNYFVPQRISQIISSLINAAKTKKVIVQIELQARFDEASNISYAEQMQTEGIELIFGKGIKGSQ
jgi:polyphosphate kinase